MENLSTHTIVLFNKALQLIPHDVQISSASDQSRELNVCKQHFNDALLTILASHPWGWATTAIPFSNANHNHHPLDFTTLRNNAARIIGIFDTKGRRVKTKTINGAFFTDCHQGVLAYIPTDPDLSNAPHYFIDALVAELAYRISGVMAGSQGNERRLKDLATMRLARAQEIDASELEYAGTDGKTFARARL